MPSSTRRSPAFPGAALCLAVLCLAACAAERPPRGAAREVPRYTIEQFLDTTEYRGLSFSHDGSKILVSSDRTGVFNAFAVPAGGGDPVRLTDSTTESILTESYFPADDRFLYLSDQGGNELTHLYVREADGTVRDLTPGENLKADFLAWAADGRSFFMTSNERDPKHFDLYEVGAAGYERTLLYRNDDGYDVEAVSPDRQLVALTRNRTRTDTDLMLHDRRTGETKNLTQHEGEAMNEARAFGADGAHLYYLSNEGSEFLHLVRHHLGTGERRVIAQPRWDVTDAALSEKGKYLIVQINNDARTEVQVLQTATLDPVPLPRLPIAEITRLAASRDEARIVFYASGSRAPGDLHVLDLASGDSRRLTGSLSPEIEPDDLVEAEVVRFKSYDGVEIPGLLYRPHGATAAAPAPALVWVHGGPGGQSRIGYSGLLQYLANHGYVVYAINNRGSSGYGRTFFAMDDRRHGDADLGDCIAGKGFLAGTGYVDPDRIGIIGGSYGGYMVLAALAFRPDEFAVGVDIFGVSNWVRTLKSIPPWWESFRLALYREMGDPAVDEEYLRRISPLFHAGGIDKPLLVLQGANDPRVLKVESDEIVEAARANGAPVEYIVFPDEGHGFQKKANREEGYRAILTFLNRHLAGGGAPDVRDDGPPG
jgi:dipeptidyl aminopeptidase/acylaminoacyl peptidase